MLSLFIPSFLFATNKAETHFIKENGLSTGTTTAFSQSITDVKKIIRGKIIDLDGNALPGTKVMVEGTNYGVVADNEGYYVIEAGVGNTLVFTAVGFLEQKVLISTKTAIDIVLEEATTYLNEAVVVGMGTQRKVSVIGSISSVNVEELKIPTRSLTNALSGKMAGMVTVQRSGEPGRDDGSFWIRGISTFGSNRTPLILVDGVERDMSNISVGEIESVSILKDASATAVYGVRAANGVVLITTRRGISQKPVIEFSIESGISDLPLIPKFLGGADYATLYNEAFGKENYSKEYIDNTRLGVDKYLYPDVNWFDEIFTKYSTNNLGSLNIRGGGETARYFVSLSYLNENGNLKNNPDNEYKSNFQLNRYNFRSNVDISLSKTSTLGIEVGGYLIDLHTPGVGASGIYTANYTPAQELFHYAYLATPISNPVQVPLGKDASGKEILGWGAPTQVGEENPAERLLGSGFGTEYHTQILSQITFNQKLPFINGLELKASFSFDTNNSTTVSRRKQSPLYGIIGKDFETGEFNVQEMRAGQEYLGYKSSFATNRAMEIKTQLLYNDVFNDVHRVGAMMMYYQRDFRNGAASSAILSLPYRKQGIAFRASYSYDDRYFGEFNVGYNGSENFPKGQRFGTFPAGAIGWLPSNEFFWQSLKDIVNVFKIKASIGLVGAESLPNGERYGYLSLYGSGFTNPHNSAWDNEYRFGSDALTYARIAENRIGVSNLTWEKGLKKNLGFELLMLKQSLKIEIDLFHERRSDILVQRQSLPAMTGIVSQPFANMGIMENYGFDGTIEYSNQIGEFGYRLYGNYTQNNNKIIEMDEPEREWKNRMRTGHPYGQQFGLIAERLFTNEDFEDVENNKLAAGVPEHTFSIVRPGDVKYKDINNDGKITIDDETAIGYSNIPKIIFGFGTQINFRNFDFGVFFRGQAKVTYALGGITYIPFQQGVGKGNLFEVALDRWTEENPRQDAFYPRIFNGALANNWQSSTRNIYDGSFIRLSDAELGYTIPKKLANKLLGMNGLRVFVNANNIAVFSKWKLWDPETGTQNGSNYPLSRKINFGIKATL